MFFYVSVLVAFASANIFYETELQTFEEGKNQTSSIGDFFNDGVGILGQFTFCFTQLMIIVGLCLDGEKSLFSRFFRTQPMQFLGRISMALYLVHEPLIFWINFVYFGMSEEKLTLRMMPNWGVFVHVPISLIAGTVLTLFVGEPARKKLKEWRNK